MLSVLRYFVPNSFQNYNHLLINDHQAACIDPFDWALAQQTAALAGVDISEIWLTHGHGDHIRGVPKHFSGPIRGHRLLEAQLPITHPIDQDMRFDFGGGPIQALVTPGHTFDHVCFYIPDLPALIAGDTLFNAGVGNTRSGDTQQLFASVQKLRQLPAATKLYNGHDYMANNLRFAEHLVGASDVTQAWLTQCDQTSVETRPITTLADEAQINLFFQCASDRVKQALDLAATSSELTVFCQLRAVRNDW